MGASPYIHEYYKKDTKTLFDETGGNTGNLAFEFAVASQLGGNPTHAHWGLDAKALRAKADIIVLPLANQLGKHTDLGTASDRLEAFGLPVIAVGLGAQAASEQVDITLTEGTERWLRTIARLAPSAAPNIGVRGAYTKSQIERYGLGDACLITGCPSNFINLSDSLAERIQAGFNRRPQIVAVNAGIPYLPKLREIEIGLAKLASDTGGMYIVQHGIEMLNIARNDFDTMKPETLSLCNNYIMPGATRDEFVQWCRRHAVAFFDARSWMDFVRRFDFVVGTRFHGAMLAMQAGVPAACIAHDSRTHEMCVTMGVPVRHYTEVDAPISLENILDYFRFDAKTYLEKRAILLRNYAEIFRAAEVQVRIPKA
jgi:hypothetical protein